MGILKGLQGSPQGLGWGRDTRNGLQKAKTSGFKATYDDTLLAEFSCYQTFPLVGQCGGWFLASDDPRGCQSCKQEAANNRLHTVRASHWLSTNADVGEGKWLMLQGTSASNVCDVYLIRLFSITSAKNMKKKNSWRDPTGAQAWILSPHPRIPRQPFPLARLPHPQRSHNNTGGAPGRKCQVAL